MKDPLPDMPMVLSCAPSHRKSIDVLGKWGFFALYS